MPVLVLVEFFLFDVVVLFVLFSPVRGQVMLDL